MKGITHFALGVSVASCFPGVVREALAGNPLLFVLGGAFGLVPDTIDFKVCRFFHRHDMEVTPDPKRPDARMIADAVAHAAMQASATGHPVRIKLNTIRLGSDRWQRYSVRFDVPGRRVVVEYGPVVNTGRRPVDGPPGRTEPGCAPLGCRVKLDYQATTLIDILDGPSFTMDPLPDGAVVPRFIPWHRRWSHSLPCAVLCGAVAAVLYRPLAGAVVLAALASHIFVDQLGFMGSNLLFPLTRRRTTGFQVVHSDAPMANFLALWLACLLVFWNLCAAAPAASHGLNPLKLFFFGAGLPLALYFGVRRAVAGGGKDSG